MLLDAGGEDPQVVIHWGTTDGGTDAGAWDRAVDLGTTSIGAFSTMLSGLPNGIQYYWRAAATNAGGATWAAYTEGFKLIEGTVLVAPGDSARYLVPADATDEATWSGAAFDDSTWSQGPTGIGYDTSSNADNYDALITTDIEAQLSGVNTSVYIRIAFDVTEPSAFGGLLLRMKFDDGFAAYLNGVEVASSRKPSPLGYDAAATSNHADDQAVIFEEFDLSASLGALVAGGNVLAIHGLNDDGNTSDFLIIPELIGTPRETFGRWIAGFPSLSGADTLPGSDPDCDELSNAEEYAFGGDPTLNELQSGGVPIGPTLAIAEVTGSRFLEITYRRRLDYQSRNVTYTPQSSTDLVAWTNGGFTQLGTPTPTGDGITELVVLRFDTAIGPRELFVHIEITAP